MRVLHVTDGYEFTGGIRTYLDHVTGALAAEGHVTAIYSARGSRETPGSWFSRWASAGHYRAVRDRLEEFRPDVLHAHSVSTRISPLPLYAARQRGIPVFMTVHDFGYVCPRKWLIDPSGGPCAHGFGWRCLIRNCPSTRPGRIYHPYHCLRWLKILLHRRMLRSAVGTFICPSAALAERMTASLRTNAVVTLPNFVAAPRRPSLPPENGRRLLFVGRLSPEKGVGCLLSALHRLSSVQTDILLTVVGDGPERPRLERLARRLELGDRVRFAGTVPNHRLAAHYSAATVCVLPSLWMENCPVSALEAMAAGRPLVGSNAGGIPEIIRNGRTGLLFRPGDSRELAAALAELLGDPARLQAMGAEARRVYEAEYTPQRHVDRILHLYGERLRP